MEGNTYLEPSALGVSLDSGLKEGISGRLLVNSPGLALAPDSGYVKDPPHPSPFEQGALDVNRRYDYLNSWDEPQSGSESHKLWW